jgi:hypothetical protein
MDTFTRRAVNQFTPLKDFYSMASTGQSDFQSLDSVETVDFLRSTALSYRTRRVRPRIVVIRRRCNSFKSHKEIKTLLKMTLTSQRHTIIIKQRETVFGFSCDGVPLQCGKIGRRYSVSPHIKWSDNTFKS